MAWLSVRLSGDRAALGASVARGALATLILRTSGMALAAAAAVILARHLGPGGYGVYSWAFAWVSALAVPAALGADQLLVRESALTLDQGGGTLRSLLRSAFIRVTVASLLTAGLLAGGFVLLGGHAPLRRSALFFALPILPLSALASLAQGSLLGLGRTPAAVAPGTIGRQGLFLVFVVVAVAVGTASPDRAVQAQLFATVLSCVVVLLLLRRALAAVNSGGQDSGAVGGGNGMRGDWLRASIPMGAATMFLVIDAQVGLLVLGSSGLSADAGVYAVALQCTAPFALLLSAGRLPLGGAIARLTVSGERDRLQRGLMIATRAVAGASALVAAILLVLPGLVLGLFGSHFSTGENTLRIVVVAQLINATCAYNGLVLIMGGLQQLAVRSALGGLLLDGVLCLALVGPLGSSGAAVALLISVSARNIVNTWLVRSRLGIDPTLLGRAPSP